jgi:hypothetical protein
LGGNTRSLGIQLTSGWALGYVINILVFDVATWVSRAVPSIDRAQALFAYGWVATVLIVIWLVKNRTQLRQWAQKLTPNDTRVGWLIAVLVIYIGVISFAEMPMPQGKNTTGAYYVDVPWHLSMAVEAKNHLITGDPNIAGESYNYYWFLYHHLASASLQTGVPLISIYFRLWFLPVMCLLALQIYTLATYASRAIAGAPFTKSPALQSAQFHIGVGLMAVALVFFVGEFDPFFQPESIFLFENAFLHFAYASPTFGFSLVTFLACVHEIWLFCQPKALANETQTEKNVGRWLIIVLLLIGTAGIKVTSLSVIVGGLMMMGFVLFFGARRQGWHYWQNYTLSLIAALAVQMGSYAFTFSGTSGGLSISPFRSIVQMYAIYAYFWLPITQRFVLSDLAKVIYAGFLLAPALLGHMALALIGIIYWLAKLLRHLPQLCQSPVFASGVWLFVCFATGLAIFLGINGVNYGQKYFMFAGYVPGCVLGAWGLMGEFWAANRSQRAKHIRNTVLGFIALVALLDTPLDHSTKIRALPNAQPLAIAYTKTMTRGLYDGMAWVRENTPTNTALAISVNGATGPDAAYFFAAGFTERRIFWGGYGNSNKTHLVGYEKVMRGEAQPYPERFALNQRLFFAPDTQTANTLRRDYGVTHLLVIKAHGGQRGNVSTIATQVFANDDLEVWRLNAV